MTIEEVERLRMFLSEMAAVCDKYSLRLKSVPTVCTVPEDETIGVLMETKPGTAKMWIQGGPDGLMEIHGEAERHVANIMRIK